MDDPYEPPKSDLTEPASKKYDRTKAQIAFDRCMYVLAGVMVVPTLSMALPDFGVRRMSGGILYAALAAWWVRSLIGILSAWHEPDAWTLRFSGLAVLALGAFGIVGLLLRNDVFPPG